MLLGLAPFPKRLRPSPSTCVIHNHGCRLQPTMQLPAKTASSSANTVFSIAELVELIFECFLPIDLVSAPATALRSLLQLQRINRLCRAVIRSSSTIRHALFLSPHSVRQLQYSAATSLSVGKLKVTPNPLLYIHFGGFTHTNWNLTHLRSENVYIARPELFDGRRLKMARFRNIKESWEDMLVLQNCNFDPAVVEIRVSGLTSRSKHSKVRPRQRQGDKKGVQVITAGQLYRSTARLIQDCNWATPGKFNVSWIFRPD